MAIDRDFASRCPMQRRPDPPCWIIIAHLKHAASRLDPVPGAPPRHKRAGQRRIEEIYRSGVVLKSQTARARGQILF
jgi:hypothetical protein